MNKNNNAFILTLAYPETVVLHADEWYSKILRFFGIGNKNYVRAGHAALVLVHKTSGVLEYHDFGRYITPEPYGRVRGKETDFELQFPVNAKIENNKIQNLDDILKFLATHSKLTHGDGVLYASVCSSVNYEMTRTHINGMQAKGFIKYAAFIKEACNCARFVTDALIAGITDEKIVSKLKRSKWFTPSTIGNVIIADTEDFVYEISEKGNITQFKSTVSQVNIRLFLDALKNYKPNSKGSIQPKYNETKAEHAQWLGGIAAGAWFEVYSLENKTHYRFRRISPHGTIDCDGIYKVDNATFKINEAYVFVHYSNCKFFHIEQNGRRYRFEYLKDFEI